MNSVRANVILCTVNYDCYTDKTVNQIFLLNKEIQNGAVIYEEGLPNV
jgi:hypothetical protein